MHQTLIHTTGSYFKRAPFFPGDVISLQVTLSAQRDGVRLWGRKNTHREARARLFMGIGHQVPCGDRRTGCFGKGGGLSNDKCFSATKPGGKYVCIPFTSCCPSMTWFLLTVLLIIYLLRLWVKRKKLCVDLSKTAINPNANVNDASRCLKLFGTDQWKLICVSSVLCREGMSFLMCGYSDII